jgi:hypothetical protein
MIELIVVTLLQAAAGEPQAQAAPAQPPAAQSAAPAEAQGEESALKRRQRMRCRRAQLTGSRLPTRLCLTAGQEQDITDESRDQLNHMQSLIPARGN